MTLDRYAGTAARSRVDCESSVSFFAARPLFEGGGERRLALPSTETQQIVGGGLASAISNGVVRLLRDYTGRGPTRARTHIDGDLVSVVLEDTLTKGERSLVQDGETALVLQARHAYQRTMRPYLVALVEQLTGRRVRAFLSDNHIDPDIAIESFVLEPNAEESQSQDA